MPPTYTIAVVGAGRVGTTLGRRWATAGHEVRYGVRDPHADRHAEQRAHGMIAAVDEACTGAEVVLLAVPGTAVSELAATLPDLGNAVVLDATNPLAADQRGHVRDPEQSAAERLAATLRGGRVVKAFNTTGSANMADPTGYDPVPVMWLAGDDVDACDVAADLVRAIGFEPVVAGGLAAARDLEHLAALWIRLAYPLGHGPDFVLTQQWRAHG